MKRALQRIIPFLFLTISIMGLLLLPNIFTKGLFLDGITYGAISNNLALGMGNFWEPHYTQTFNPVFYGHPPLAFFLESLLMSLFDGAFFVERLFSLLVFIISAVGIHMLWKEIYKQESQLSWLPLLIWAISPLIFWSFGNNMLENTLSVFMIYSVLFYLKWIHLRKFQLLLFATFLVFLGFLTKGFVSLFPLTCIIAHALISNKNKKEGLIYSFITLIILGVYFIILFITWPASYQFFKSYLEIQFIPALTGENEITTSSRFLIIWLLIQDLLLPLIIFLSLWIAFKIRKVKVTFVPKTMVLFFLSIGLFATLPICITLKQRGFYVVPAIPFYSIALALLILPFIKSRIEKIKRNRANIIGIISGVILSCSLVLSITFFGNYSRDKEMLSDVQELIKILPEKTIISSSVETCSEWSFIGYLSRFGSISCDGSKKTEYLLIPFHNGKLQFEAPDGYKKVDAELKNFILYASNPIN